MVKVGYKKILVALKGNVKKNWGSPFIVAFVILLPVSTFSEFISVSAFYALVVGVFLQVVCFLKYKESDASEVYNGSS